MITFDDFKKVEIKVGKILSAEKIEGSDKLLKLSVELGEESPRTIVSGIAGYFPEPESIVGKKCAFATNIEPRTIFGIPSNGMILAARRIKNNLSLLSVDDFISAGEIVG